MAFVFKDTFMRRKMRLDCDGGPVPTPRCSREINACEKEMRD